MNLDLLLKEIRHSGPTDREAEAAAARVRERLFPAPAEAAAAAHRIIRSCGDFQLLIPGSLANALDADRRLLLEMHLRECVACRKSLEKARSRTAAVLSFEKAPARTFPRYTGWALAATALLAVAISGYIALRQYPALAGGPRATVASVQGALYRVSGASQQALAPGAEIGESDTLRTARNSTAVLRLNDGSRIELNQRAEISVTRTMAGSTIHLGSGSIIVEAAKQRQGFLRVVTADCNVAVKGTVFSVDTGARGSRVAVAEGTVWVDHGGKQDVLHRGDQTATAPDMTAVPIRDEFGWSRNSAEYMALLGEFRELKREISALPAPELRHVSRLLAWLPADVQLVAAIPNIGGALGEAVQIFHGRLNQSPALAAWWEHRPAAQRERFEEAMGRLQTASAYLGDEIVIAAWRQSSPVILAQIRKPGLDAFLRSQLAPEALEHMRFDNDLFAAATDQADLTRVAPSGDFLNSALYRKIAPLYQQGAGWFFAADLAQAGPFGHLGDVRFLIDETRTVAGVAENRASVTFNKPWDGMAAWLASPAPLGSLDFISPDAAFAASLVLRNPSAIVEDLTTRMHIDASDADALKSEMAGAFGGEVSIAIDGPLLPVPSWKIAAEVYDPDRLSSAIARLAGRNPDLHLTRSDSDGRTFYTLKSDKLPWEADWTFVDGYWLAAANHELLLRSIQNRQTGYSLTRSNGFRAALPRDARNSFSGLIYHHFGSAPGVICLWAASDRIDMATSGNLLGVTIDTLLSTPPEGLIQNLLSARNGREAIAQ